MLDQCISSAHVGTIQYYLEEYTRVRQNTNRELVKNSLREAHITIMQNIRLSVICPVYVLL